MAKRKKVNVDKWTNSEGNVCFRFPMKEPMEKQWIIVAIGIVLTLIVLIYYLYFGSTILLYPAFIIFVGFFLWWIDIDSRYNEPIIRKTIHSIMDPVVKEDARIAGVEVEKSIVYHDQKGTYGIVEATNLLILLSNKEVWEYPIKYHGPQNGKYAYFECIIKYVVSDNEKHIRKIHPQRLRRLISGLKLSDNASMGLLIAAVIIIGALPFVGFLWLATNFKWWHLWVIVGYLIVYKFTEWVYSKLPWKVLNVLIFVMSIPLAVLFLMAEFTQPFITIVGTYFFLVLFVFGVPASILVLLVQGGILDIRFSTIAFLVISFGSILCSHSFSMSKFLIRHTPIRDWGNHTYESYREKLAFYLIHPSNIMFMLYLVYFVFLAISGYRQIQYGDYLISESFDGALLKAFLVYIAFTNMRTKASVAEMDVKGLLQRTLLLFEHDK